MICSPLSGMIVQADTGNLDKGLQVWYKFDETSGTIAKDSSGNDRDGTVMGGAEWITTVDDEGVALELDNTVNSGKYVDVPTSVMEDVTDDFTISTWIKVEDCPIWGRILDYGTSTSNVMLWTANSYYFKMDNDDAKPLSRREMVRLRCLNRVVRQVFSGRKVTALRGGSMLQLPARGIHRHCGLMESDGIRMTM